MIKLDKEKNIDLFFDVDEAKSRGMSTKSDNGKKACLFLNGEIKNIAVIESTFKQEKYGLVIGVDGGANYLKKMGVAPDYIVGDLDSIDEDFISFFKNMGTEFKKYPEKKNETDTELAIWLAKDLGATSIDLYGALGGRVDHEIANIQLLYYILERGLAPRIIDDKVEIYIVGDSPLIIKGEPGEIISTMPIHVHARGVTLEGLEYQLEKYDMEYSKPRGISNVMLGHECRIDLEEGRLLVIKNKL